MVDVSDISAQRLVKTLDESRGAWGVKIFSNRSNPGFLRRLLETEKALGSCVEGGQLITTVKQGMKALDISRLDDVKELSFFHTPWGIGRRMYHASQRSHGNSMAVGVVRL